MKPTLKPISRYLAADPQTVRKVRRAQAAYTFFEGLPGERDHDYLPAPLPQPRRLAEFGRPGL
ncbi:hypothetical protein ACFST9_06960 [Hymenobacter monticola]|uniref:Uncharacterized protein n=1 Tax=Hymenobacter monticola TaxID=1705399 RepID=A0ABY4B7C3_9BACT|nr:hypothetical protein [Hymenobacter monticola]UOE33601.1 hypothetical protein MTP16_21065 [Hymenobacter monticola]